MDTHLGQDYHSYKILEIIAPFLCEAQGDRLSSRPQMVMVHSEHCNRLTQVKFVRNPVMAIWLSVLRSEW